MGRDTRARRILVFVPWTLVLAAACVPSSTLLLADGGADEASVAAVDGSSETGADTGASTSDGAVDAAGDAGTPAANPRLSVLKAGGPGTVQASLHLGNAWYIGGDFDRISLPTPNLIAIDGMSTAPTACALGAGFDGDVQAIAQTPSAIYVGGGFTTYQGVPVGRIVKIDPTTCTLDAAFVAGTGFDLPVNALAVDGSDLFVGGAFTMYRGVTANRIAKLTTTGDRDASFAPSVNGFDGTVSALAVSATHVYVGGLFTQYKSVPSSANRIARLDRGGGMLDTTFSPPANNGFNGAVSALALDGADLYAGGAFTQYRGVSANRVAKLRLPALVDGGLPDGGSTDAVLDATFSPAAGNGCDNSVTALALNATDVYVGGSFTQCRGAPASRIARLDRTTGTINTAFSPGVGLPNGFDGPVESMVLAGSLLYVGGKFTAYRGVPGSANLVAAITLMGDPGTVFQPPGHNAVGLVGATVRAAVVSGKTIWFGGAFTSYAGFQTSNVAKLDDVRLTVDTTFSPLAANGFDGPVSALAGADKTLYVGGAFGKYKGISNSALGIAKIDALTGAIDSVFGPVGTNGFNGGVSALSLDGTDLFVGGAFSAYRGLESSATNIAKLNAATGDIDLLFFGPPGGGNGFSASVTALGFDVTHLYVGGDFAAYNKGNIAAARIAKIARSTGILDTTFGPVDAGASGFPAGSINALAVGTADVYVGGSFTTYRGTAGAANRIAKLAKATGALDTTFGPPLSGGFDGPVLSLALTGTDLYAGGSFTKYRAAASPVARIARLNATTGALDTTFSPGGSPANGFDGTGVRTLALAPSCGPGCGPSVLVGGAFTSYRGTFIGNGLVVLDQASGASR